MAVLVAYAGTSGVTRQIAKRIARTLAATGQDARACPLSAAGDIAGYGAVVIGGSVHWGRWQPEATEFVRANRAGLAGRRVWLFGAGRPGADDAEVAGLSQEIGARGHRVFIAMPGAGRSWRASRTAAAEVETWALSIAEDPGFARPGRREPDHPLVAWAAAVDVSRLSDRTARAIESYLQTYRRMSADARGELAFRLVSAVTAQVSPPPPLSIAPLDIFAAVLAARRAGGAAT
jgi:flavodoxin